MFSVADVFSGDINETALVYVPVGSKASYQAADGWSDFKNYDEGKLLQTVTPKDYLKYSYHTGLKTATVIEIVTPDDLTDQSIPGTVEIDNTSYVVDKIAPSVVFSNKAKITSLTVGSSQNCILTVLSQSVQVPSKVVLICRRSGFQHRLNLLAAKLLMDVS